MLGPYHELDVPDLWQCVRDSRVPREGASYFLNMRRHELAWAQPEGTLLCGQCARDFAGAFCGTCGSGLCDDCLDAGAGPGAGGASPAPALPPRRSGSSHTAAMGAWSEQLTTSHES